MRILEPLFPNLIGAVGAILLLVAPAFAADVPLDHQVISFWSDGSPVKGDVFRPRYLKAGQRLPGIATRGTTPSRTASM